MSATQPATERVVTVRGGHHEMGRQLGEQCGEGIERALEHILSEVSPGRRIESVRAHAEQYRPYVQRFAPHLDEELAGLAAGAGIHPSDALLLQVRFEFVGYGDEAVDGCTSFVVRRGGRRVTGQNVDTSPPLEDMGIVLRMVPDEGPTLLMYTYFPGMLGYLGINSAGLACFGNAVLCPGWRAGFPRYFVLRRILEQTSVADAIATVRPLERASSINCLVSDSTGAAANIELTVDAMAILDAGGDTYTHTNHYLAPEFREQERLLFLLPDSEPRLETARRRLGAVGGDGSVVEEAMEVLRDHSLGPSGICRHSIDGAERPAEQWKSIASLVAVPDEGELYVAFGSPCQKDYLRVTL